MEMLIYLLSIVCVQYHPISCQSILPERIKVEVDGGFTGIVIAIDPNSNTSNSTQQLSLINGIKELWTEASEALYLATNNIFYLKEIEIVVPNTWTSASYKEADILCNYEDADVIVEKANPSHGDEPYTVQYRPCGQYGSRIHITPNFITDKVPARQKSIVREWARLRWGIFDERGSDGNLFYYNSNQSLEATRCPEAIKGSIESNISNCEPEDATGYPPEGCKFIPSLDQDNITGSIMSHPSIDKIVSFCHDNDSNLMNKHNMEAPNDQNRYCNFRSTWGVISMSADYNKTCSGMNPCSLPIPLTIKPNITVVKMKRIKKIVLLVDIQYNVTIPQNLDNTGTKQQDVATACAQFVELYAPLDMRIAVIMFDQYFGLPYYMMNGITNQIDRDNLVNKLDKMTKYKGLGRTRNPQSPPNTHVAVDLAINIILNSGHTEAAEIIVFTNGKGEWKNTTGRRLLKEKIRLSTVYLSNTVMPELDELTLKSGGRRAFAPDLIALHDHVVTIAADMISSKQFARINIKRERIFAESGMAVEGSVLLDVTAHNETLFRFVYFCTNYAQSVAAWRYHCANVPKISVFSASGTEYATPTAQKHNRIDFHFPGSAEKGKWRYVLEDNGVNAGGTGAVVLVSSFSSDPDKPPITVHVRTSESVVNHTDENPSFGMYAEVFKGHTPILNSVVVANVSSPTGKTYSYPLLDKGTGADLRKDDGIYSAYFIDFYEQGIHTISVSAVGKWSKESKKRSLLEPWNDVVLKNGANVCKVNCEENTSSITKRQAVEEDSFQRQRFDKQFQFIGQPLNKSADNFAPSRITDLRVEQINIHKVSEGFRYRFTAVGDEGMRGNASRYSFSYTSKGEYREPFAVIPKESIIEGDLESPKVAGQREEFVVSFPYKIANLDEDKMLRFGFSATAYDKMGRPSPVSNIVMIDIFWQPGKEEKGGKDIAAAGEKTVQEGGGGREEGGGGREEEEERIVWGDSEDNQEYLWLVLIIFIICYILFMIVFLYYKKCAHSLDQYFYQLEPLGVGLNLAGTNPRSSAAPPESDTTTGTDSGNETTV